MQRKSPVVAAKMGCRIAKQNLPYTESLQNWYFALIDNQVYVEILPSNNYQDIVGAKLFHDTVCDWFRRLDSHLSIKCSNALRRAIHGIEKVRKANGDSTNVMTIKINDYYAKQRLTCIELVEDVVNTFYKLNFYVTRSIAIEFIENIIDEYIVCFKENKRIFSNNFKTEILWNDDHYVTRTTTLHNFASALSDAFEVEEAVVSTPQLNLIKSYQHGCKRRLGSYSRRLCHVLVRAKRGEKCQSKKFLRRLHH